MSAGPSETEDRFEAMYHRTAPDILSYLVRRLPTREDAADLLADVYLVAWRRWHDLPVPPEDRLWLFGVARRTLLAKRRSEVRRHEAARSASPDTPHPCARHRCPRGGCSGCRDP